MGDVYRVRTVFTGVTGTPWLSTQFFETVDPPSLAEATAAQLKVRNFVNGYISAVSSTVSIAVQSTVDLLSETSGDLVDSFECGPFAGVGTLAGDPLPWAVQGSMRINTGVVRNGRRVRGKVFLPGATENVNTAGAPTATYIADVNSAGATLLAAPASPGLCVWRRPVNGAGGEAVTANGVDTLGYWAVLRSRRD